MLAYSSFKHLFFVSLFIGAYDTYRIIAFFLIPAAPVPTISVVNVFILPSKSPYFPFLIRKSYFSPVWAMPIPIYSLGWYGTWSFLAQVFFSVEKHYFVVVFLRFACWRSFLIFVQHTAWYPPSSLFPGAAVLLYFNIYPNLCLNCFYFNSC